MTAQEKFDARLKEVGLDVEYESTGDRAGKVLDDGTIVILVHYAWEPHDPYSEFRYPPFEELWKDEDFRQACKKEYYGQTNDYKFEAQLAYWLDIHDGLNGCPLFPVDLYWLTSKDGKTFESFWTNYEDDVPTAEDIIKNLVKEHSVA